jgi:tellurite methyltransferase
MAGLQDSIDFFSEQFARQVRDHEFPLNPFESLALEHIRGDVLDLGCGLGNLSLAAARRGCHVLAVDASPVAIEHLRQAAAAEGLAVEATKADLRTWTIPAVYDTIIAIGLLMFFPRERAVSLLREIADRVAPGGLAVLNVLTEGTTFMDMFGSADYYLFGRDELRELLPTWEAVTWQHDSFAAPEGTRKEFATLVARKPV